jgi:hypothetical protein
MKKIGIIYICTGNYWKFWQDFFESSEHFFLNDCEKLYFLYTDNRNIFYNKNSRIKIIYSKYNKWPFSTLLRYKLIYDCLDLYNNIDYLIFCNSNLLFLKKINLIELFNNKPMFATLHPGYFKKFTDKLPFEKNKYSTAYFERDIKAKYFCGGFNGGSVEKYLEMSKQLMLNIDKDLENNIIAKWHDESHFNKYVNKNLELFNIIDPSFCYPENRLINTERNVLVRDKDKIISLKHKGIFYNLRYTFIKKIRSFKNFIIDFLLN